MEQLQKLLTAKHSWYCDGPTVSSSEHQVPLFHSPASELQLAFWLIALILCHTLISTWLSKFPGDAWLTQG